MKLGLIVRSDNTGLGNQTRELFNMLNPTKIMLINSFSFNKNKQHPEWYNGANMVPVRGFPRTSEINQFIRGLDVVLTCETFYNHQFIDLAKRAGVKTVLQYNYEFLDHLIKHNLTLPDVFLGPSVWNIDNMIELFGDRSKVVHLPPPIDHTNFESVKNNNMSMNHKRLLHIGGKAASEDRNGTKTVIDMLRYSKEDYEIVIKTQTPLDINCNDPRLKISLGDFDDRENLYNGFDGMVLPRRYAGLCLPMNEALISGLPVFMTDISPNNAILPREWLAKSEKIGTLKTRAVLDVYSADPKYLAKVIDNYMKQKNKKPYKEHAYEIGMKNFAAVNLKDKYLDILSK